MFNQVFGEQEARRIGKWMTISLALLSTFLLFKIITDAKRLPSVGKEVYPQSTITVSGKGEAYAIPDVAAFNFSVTETADTVKDAQAKLDQKISAALAAVREAGIEDKDIKTVNYNVYPKYEWEQKYCVQMVGVTCPSGKNVLKGYEVSQTVLVKVREVAKAADLVTKVGALNVSNISGLEFTVDNRDTFVAQAREEAIGKAQEQAKTLAKQLGVRLGRVLYFNDNSGYPMPYAEGMGGVMMDKVSAVAPQRAELPTGENKISADISITYEIK